MREPDGRHLALVECAKHMSEPPSQTSDPRDQYIGLLDSVLEAAWSVDSFGALCALLRVGGMEDANWDPFEESRAAFEDYNWMLESVREAEHAGLIEMAGQNLHADGQARRSRSGRYAHAWNARQASRDSVNIRKIHFEGIT